MIRFTFLTSALLTTAQVAQKQNAKALINSLSLTTAQVAQKVKVVLIVWVKKLTTAQVAQKSCQLVSETNGMFNTAQVVQKAFFDELQSRDMFTTAQVVQKEGRTYDFTNVQLTPHRWLRNIYEIAKDNCLLFNTAQVAQKIAQPIWCLKSEFNTAQVAQKRCEKSRNEQKSVNHRIGGLEIENLALTFLFNKQRW